MLFLGITTIAVCFCKIRLHGYRFLEAENRFIQFALLYQGITKIIVSDCKIGFNGYRFLVSGNRIIQIAETPLSDRGLEQAGRLGRRLSSEPIKEIWTSHLSRARMTAEAVEQSTGAPLVEVPTLEERNLGALRGTA